MDTVTVAPPASAARDDYWARMQALRAELGRLRPAARHHSEPRRLS